MNWPSFLLGMASGFIGVVLLMMAWLLLPVKKTREEKGWENFNKRKDKNAK